VDDPHHRCRSVRELWDSDLQECFRHGQEGRSVEGSVIAKAWGTLSVTALLVAMSSLKDDNIDRVCARWDGMNEANPCGCHVAFDQ
jgi:hypothetical protein